MKDRLGAIRHNTLSTSTLDFKMQVKNMDGAGKSLNLSSLAVYLWHKKLLQNSSDSVQDPMVTLNKFRATISVLRNRFSPACTLRSYASMRLFKPCPTATEP